MTICNNLSLPFLLVGGEGDLAEGRDAASSSLRVGLDAARGVATNLPDTTVWVTLCRRMIGGGGALGVLLEMDWVGMLDCRAL